jgi:hypothetical protein
VRRVIDPDILHDEESVAAVRTVAAASLPNPSAGREGLLGGDLG